MPGQYFSVRRRIVGYFVMTALFGFPFWVFLALAEAPLWWSTPLQLDLWHLIVVSFIATAIMLFFGVSVFLISGDRERWGGIALLIIALVVALAFVAWVLFPSLRVSTDYPPPGVIRP